MKNTYVLCLMALAFFANSFFATAQMSPTASDEIYNWTPYGDVAFLELFYETLQEGRNYPTEGEIRNKFGFDMEFSRSHVRPNKVMANQSKQVNPDINPDRKLWMNIPGGIGKGNGGYPSSLFNNDVYSMWQYTHLFGSWNHALFQAPGSWGDAAHKHGTDIFSGIKFFESWTPGSGDKEYSAFISQKNPDGSFKYAEPLINILMYLGLDGINYNWEDGSYSNADIIAFHKELFRIAKQKEFNNFHIGLYTLSSGLTTSNVESLYYGDDPVENTIDLMLNYSGGDFAFSSTPASIAAAKTVTPDKHNVYQGVWIVTMDRAWPAMNTESRKEMNLCLWGEHGQSRFMSYNAGTDAVNIQENYQKLLERAFSGGNRNPANLPPLTNSGNNWEQIGDKEPLSTFGGLAAMIAERPIVQGKLPFWTNFQLGNGERYHYKGKKTFGNWYEMGAQDYQPTYRWLVYDAGTTTVSTDIQPSYTHKDAYTGGSTLELTGAPTANGTDIVLYRTDLEVSAANPKVTVAVKSYKEGTNPTLLNVILKKKDSDTWIEVPVGNTTGKTWEEMTLAVDELAVGDYIELIGLRVKGTSTDPYQLYVGKLSLTDDREVKEISPIEDLVVEVKRETQQSMALKLNWKVSPLASSPKSVRTGLVYNDEANVDHFEIVYKNGENGKVSELVRTSTWSSYVGDIVFGDKESLDEPYIGVRAASIDGKSYSQVEWVKVPRADASELPVYVESEYCSSEINPDAEGVNIARAQRYLTEVKTIGLTDNLNYTADAPVADGTQYKDATDYSFTANQSETFEFFFKANDASDGLKWCIAKAYIDYDNNGVFDPETEEVFDLGTIRKGTEEFQTTGVTRSFTVPEFAAPGPVRLRVVFSDAWFPHPGPCGLTAKGFSIDFTLNITGTNPPVVAEDTRDQGTADEPDKIHDGETSVDELTDSKLNGASYFFPNPVENIVNFRNTQQVWIYSINGKLMFTQKGNLDNVNLNSFDSGVYMVKMLNNNVVRTEKLKKN